MLLPLFEYLSEFFGPFRVVEFLSTRAILATLTSLLFSLVLGPKFINKMKDIQVGQVIREEGPDSHLSKQGTPTMGGTLILSSIFFKCSLVGRPRKPISMGCLFDSYVFWHSGMD